MGHVLMFHLGRCGSTVLGRMLDQHPGLTWGGELYEGPTRDAPAWTGGSSRWARSRFFPHDPVGFLQKSLETAPGAFGFEVKPYHLRLNGIELDQYLTGVTALDVDRFLLLSRRNHLRKVVSSLTARRAGRYHRKSGGAARSTRLAIDCSAVRLDNQERSLKDFFRSWEAELDEIRRAMSGRHFLELRYEDDVEQDPRRAYDRILAFLELDPFPAQVTLARTTPFPLADIVTNLTEVLSHLSGTPWEWMARE